MKRKSGHKEYLPEEIPPEYREKPPHPYSFLIATALRAKAGPAGISLSEIYKGIQELFPYYKYCNNAWKHSVRHNLSSNKAFLKVSKEGKGWLWGLDDEYFMERERLRSTTSNKSKTTKKEESSPTLSKVPTTKPEPLATEPHSVEQEPSVVSPQIKPEPKEEDVVMQETPAEVKKETVKSKTIAELAREIKISSGNERLYRPSYSGASKKENSKEETSSSDAGPSKMLKATNSIAENEAILNSPRYKHYYSTMPPIPASISKLPPSIGNIEFPPSSVIASPSPSASSTSGSMKSLADGQSTFRMSQVPKQNTNATEQKNLKEQTSVPKMRVNPQVPASLKDTAAGAKQSSPVVESKAASPVLGSSQGSNANASSSAASEQKNAKAAPASNGLGNLKLPKETLRVLGALQEKIKAQLEASGQSVSTSVLTNALAIAITQLSKGGNGGLASLIKGNNQTALVNAIATAVKKQSSQRRPSASSEERPVVKQDSATPIAQSASPPAPQPLEASPESTKPEPSKSPVETKTTPSESPQPALSKPQPEDKLKSVTTTEDVLSGKQAGSPAPPASADTVKPKPEAKQEAKSESKSKKEVIADMLAKASKLTNPSPSIRAALVQLQAHALKLGLEIPENLKNITAESNGNKGTASGSKRPMSEISDQGHKESSGSGPENNPQKLQKTV